jgi:hypothetical protein
MTQERECKFCERRIGVTPSGHLRAHACPHGSACVLSYVARRRGDKVKRCAECVASRQLSLPLGEDR